MCDFYEVVFLYYLIMLFHSNGWRVLDNSVKTLCPVVLCSMCLVCHAMLNNNSVDSVPFVFMTA
jgi:hypothetical protein